jgi:hypothetical protein
MLVAVAIVLTAPVSAQTSAPPDISGTWRLNLGKSKLKTARKIKSQMLMVVSSDSIVEVRMTTNGTVSTRTYAVDGNEHFLEDTANAPYHFRTYHTTKWESDALVIRLRMTVETSDAPMVGGAEGDHFTESWSLSPDGRALTRTLISKGTVPYAICVYDRQ